MCMCVVVVPVFVVVVVVFERVHTTLHRTDTELSAAEMFSCASV